MIDESTKWLPEVEAVHRSATEIPVFDPFAKDPRLRQSFGDERDEQVARLVSDRRSFLAESLNELDGFLSKYVHFESETQRIAVVLWTAATYVVDAFEVAPYLHVKSPEKQSGKTLLLEVIELTAADTLLTSNLSAAALFRVMDDRHPTLLIDEVDSIFPTGNRVRDTGREELRGLINSGYRRGAVTLRVGGPRRDKVEEYDAFGLKALAGIGELPDTISDRCIPIRLQRKPPSVRLERWRRRLVKDEAAGIADRLDLALIDLDEVLAEKWPELPHQLSDRQADLWEPLLAIADYAGDKWPLLARDAAIQLHAGGDQAGETIGVRLLADCRAVFAEEPALWTKTLLARLHALDEAPWGDWYGNTITARFLAERLRPYGIRSQNIRISEVQKKGYQQSSFAEAWDRYLPAPTSYDPSQASQPSQPSPDMSSGAEDPASRTRPASVPSDHATPSGRMGTAPESARNSGTTSDGTLGTNATAETGERLPEVLK